MKPRRHAHSIAAALATAIASALALGACAKTDKPQTVRLDYATYNPVGLLLREKGFLEQELASDGVKVEWVKSLGSNKSLELLSSKSVDFGSTAGAAALLAKANGNPIRAVYVYSKPEWTALVTRADAGVESIADLRGKKIAVTRGTDPFVFLLRALDSVGLTDKDVEIVPLQHPDGKAALERGDVAAWAGLDPLMATAELESGARLFFRNADWNTYGVLNVRDDFAQRHPAYVNKVLAAYEKARAYAIAHPDELRAALVKEAHLTPAVADAVLARTDLSSSLIGDRQRDAISAAGGVLKKTGIVKADADVSAVAASLIDPAFGRALAH
ncbi:MAG TPA: aliphatic sulfonate ABC transporter substrate-binding protein [Anaeromyxobacteraceae bacterium]|nr:aliphatic sulfonate ABC transporter substrate-binding protein [Anaeromyxobacteraceae bacterium]